MPSSITDALALLDQAQSQVKAVLRSLGSIQPTPEPLAQVHMSEYVGALAGIQQCLKSFASTPPGSREQHLQKDVQALEQELLRAERLLADADMKVNEWQADIQALRTAHETALTDSGNTTQTRQRTAAAAGNEVVIVAAGPEDGGQQL